MSLKQVVESASFDDATTDAEREQVYVSASDLGIAGPSPDDEIVGQFGAGSPRRRIRISGPSGAGKTSLILRAIKRLGTESELPVEVLVLRVGDSTEVIKDKSAMFKHVLDLIESNDHRFSNVDADLLAAATAESQTKTPRTVDHSAGGQAGIKYQANIKAAFTTQTFRQNEASLPKDVADVLREIEDAGYRPIFVVDDTEKFVAPGAHGMVDREAVHKLFDHGVRALLELEADVVVLTHPRFDEVETVAQVLERDSFVEVEVPVLPASAVPPAITKVLLRRLKEADIDTPLQNIISESALDELQTLYQERQQNLRSVLKLAHNSAQAVFQDGRTLIEAPDVRKQLENETG